MWQTLSCLKKLMLDKPEICIVSMRIQMKFAEMTASEKKKKLVNIKNTYLQTIHF